MIVHRRECKERTRPMISLATLYRLGYPAARILFRLFGRFITEVRCIIEREGRVLLVRHSYGPDVWCLPGGAARPWERPEKAIRREVFEEVRVTLSEVFQLPGYSSNGDYEPANAYCFYAKVADAGVTPDPGEIAQADWFDVRILPDRLSGDTRLALSLKYASQD